MHLCDIVISPFFYYVPLVLRGKDKWLIQTQAGTWPSYYVWPAYFPCERALTLTFTSTQVSNSSSFQEFRKPLQEFTVFIKRLLVISNTLCVFKCLRQGPHKANKKIIENKIKPPWPQLNCSLATICII